MTSTTNTAAARLHAAARKIRATAEPTSPQPWTAGGPGAAAGVTGEHHAVFCSASGWDVVALTGHWGARPTSPADAAHIATWHPGVALAVADWLERIAFLLTNPPVEYIEAGTNDVVFPDYRVVDPAVQLANLILGDELSAGPSDDRSRHQEIQASGSAATEPATSY